MLPHYPAEHIQIPMRPCLADVFLKYTTGKDALASVRFRLEARQPNGETTLRLERVQAVHGIQFIFSDKLEAIFERDHDGSIYPGIKRASQLIHELLV